MHAVRLLILIALTGCLPSIQAATESDSDAESAAPPAAANENGFEAGLAAYREGNFPLALARFRAARSAGDDSPQLAFNIALTLLQLDRLAEARDELLQLRNEPDWADLAEYRLGQVAERQEKQREAIDIYSGLVDEASNPRLRRLAATRIDQLTQGSDDGDDAGWLRLISLSHGSDSNVIALPDGLQQSSGRGDDTFTDVLAYLTSNAARAPGMAFEAFAFQRSYSEMQDFDSRSLGLGMSYTNRFDAWDIEYRGRLARSTVGGETLQRDLLGGVTARTRGDAPHFSFGYEFTQHAAGSTYPQLDGHSQQVFAGWQFDAGNWRWQARYAHERVDRADLVSGPNRYSYSPRRNSLEIEARWKPTKQWMLAAGIRHIDSRYDGQNSLLDIDGQRRTAQRNGEQLRSSIEIEYRLDRHWRLNLDFRQYDNDDNFEIYRYRREIVSLGIGAVF